MIDLHLVDDGEVELVEDDRLRDMRGELGMPLHHRHRPRAPAFVGGRKFRRAAERESRDHLDRECGGVVVVDHDGDVGLGLAPSTACDFSKPENTRFQYGSSVLPLSIAAPMAGTCDDPTPAMILATVHFRFAEDLDLDFALRLWLWLGLRDLAAACRLPDLLRLPSTERPPASIILA